MNRLSYKTLFIILLFLLIPIVFLLRINQKGKNVSAAWWNNSWTYRKAISISNPSGSNLTDFQVSMDIGTSALIASNKMQSDCDDIRITDQNGQVLSHWIEEGNSGCNAPTDTKIWVKTTSLPSVGTTFYFYYGNSQTNNVENGDNVFEFFDNFDGTNIDTNKWTGGTIAITSGTNFSVSSGTLNGGNTNRYLQSINTFTGNYIAETRVYETTPVINGFTSLGFYSSSSNCIGILIHNNTSYARNDANWPNFGSFTTSQWEKNYISVIGSTAFISRTGETSGIVSASYTNSGISNEYFRIGARFDNSGYNQNFVAKWDYFFVRKAVSSAPTATLAAEELRPETGIDIGGTNIQTPPGNLIVYYKFDEGAGTVVHNSGTRSSTLDASNVNVTLTNDGKINKALNFTGANVYYVQSNNGLLLNSGQTYSAWVYHTSSGWLEGILTTHNYVNTSNLGINTSNDHFSISIGYTDGSREYNTKESNYVIAQNKWTHVVLKYDNIENSVSFYINGTFDSKWILNKTVKFTSEKVLLGQWSNEYLNNSYKFSGLIDEAKIYDYALSDNEIKREYNQSSSVVFSVDKLNVGSTSTSAIYCVPGSTDYCSAPVAEWKFEEGVGTTVYDTSGGSYTGIATTQTSIVIGKHGKARKTSNSSGQITFPAYSTPASWTAEAWALFPLPITTDGWRTLLSHNAGTYHHILVQNDGLIGTYNGAFYSSGFDTDALSPGWHYITAVGSGSSTAYFIDGTLKGTASSKISTSDFSSIGNYGGTNGQWFGTFDDVRIYNYARTPAQIAWDYNQGAPIGWWKFDECQGSIAHDSSGIGNTGSIIIGAGGTQTSVGTCNTSGTAWGIGATGKFNSSLNFDGIDDYVNLGSNSSTRLISEMSISAWLKLNNDYITAQALVSNINSSGQGANYHTEFGRTDNKFTWHQSDGTIHATSIRSISDNNWHHLTAIRSGIINNWTITFYIDGILDSITSNITTNPGSSPENTAIGRAGSYSGFYLKGTLDDVRIYNYALTSQQIKQIYNGGAINFN